MQVNIISVISINLLLANEIYSVGYVCLEMVLTGFLNLQLGCSSDKTWESVWAPTTQVSTVSSTCGYLRLHVSPLGQGLTCPYQVLCGDIRAYFKTRNAEMKKLYLHKPKQRLGQSPNITD